MKKYVLISFLFPFIHLAYSQPPSVRKPALDSNAIVKWQTLAHQPSISNDGGYFVYGIENLPFGSSTLVVKAVNSSWEKDIVGVNSGEFTRDNKQLIYRSNDTLYFLKLGSNEQKFIIQIASYQIINGEWLLYQSQGKQNDLYLKNLINGKEVNVDGVVRFSVTGSGNILLLEVERRGSSSLLWINMTGFTQHIVWSSEEFNNRHFSLKNHQFDKFETQLVFMIEEKSLDDSSNHSAKETVKSIWYYKMGMNRALPIIERKLKGIDSGFLISNSSPEFSDNGKYIFFHLIKKDKLNRTEQRDSDPTVEILSYKDSVLRYQQDLPNEERTYYASFNLDTKRIIRIEHEDERFGGSGGDFAIAEAKTSISEYWWPSFSGKTQWLVSLYDGSRKAMKSMYVYSFSPNGKYLVYYSPEHQHYFSYNLASGKIQNISGGIPTAWLKHEGAHINLPTKPNPVLGITGWISNNKEVLVYDNYDIWRLNIEGNSRPINVTNGYGRLHHIKFRITNYGALMDGISDSSKLLLTAFDTRNKYNGFFSVELNRKSNPKMLVMGPWTFFLGGPDVVPNDKESMYQMEPIKASSVEKWVVKRESATEAPNYYITDDFKSYKALTNLQPQKDYNWLSTELVTWKQLDGTISQGVLYKPEDFNPQKKYPIIFLYYELLSHNMYGYPFPNFAGGRINIPWFVSHGYLVFTPDIHYSIASKSGKVVGDHAVNSVVSAAKYLSLRSYIDSTKMGIQGHSFAGGETLYIITHTKKFAAACAVAPTVSNEISSYLEILRANGKPKYSKMLHSEIGHNKIGATLWQRPDLYVRASPVFNANQVSTPLLLMHNQGDLACDWVQSIQMYMALRRLGRRVWMLQYPKGGHVVRGNDAVDFTVRLDQFFDHYLRDNPAPNWMIVPGSRN